MNWLLFISGAVQILLSLVLGVLFIYLAFLAFSRLTRGIDGLAELANNNISGAIVNGSIILSIVYLMRNALEPAILILTNTMRDPNAEAGTYLRTAWIIFLQIGVTAILGFLSMYVALQLFIRLTRDLNEFDEVRKNNIAVGILMGVVIFCIAMLVQPGIRTLLDALIPFPNVSFRNIGVR